MKDEVQGFVESVATNPKVVGSAVTIGGGTGISQPLGLLPDVVALVTGLVSLLVLCCSLFFMIRRDMRAQSKDAREELLFKLKIEDRRKQPKAVKKDKRAKG